MKRMQCVAAAAIRYLVTAQEIDWALVYRIERRFKLVGYGDRFHDGMLAVRRAYIALSAERFTLPAQLVVLN